MAAEREVECKTLNIQDQTCENGMNVAWGLGNQLFVSGTKFPKDKDKQPGDHSNLVHGPPFIHEVRWNTDMHNPVTRKLVNESHNIFLTVQSYEPDLESTRKPQLVKFSRQYRSVLKACIMDLRLAKEASMDEDEKQFYGDYWEMFGMIELIWSMCEILFVETLPGGVVLVQLLDWLKWHFTQGDFTAREVMSEDEPEKHEQYWDAVYHFILQGRIDEGRKLLSLHSERQLDHFQSIDELLRKMPLFTYFTGQSLTEFDLKWRHWQEECVRRLEEGEFVNHLELQTICRMLCGDDQVFHELKDISEYWYQMFVSKLLYQNPTVKAYDLQYHAQGCIDAFGGTSRLDPLDNILLSAIEYDLHQVIKESSAHFSNWWFVAHLADLLTHCGQLESHQMFFGSNQREYLLLEYASSLMSHESLWQVGASYLDQCPVFGRQYLEHYIERIPVNTEKKAQKLLRICEQRGMTEQARSLCKVMGMKALHNGRLGTSLSWCLKSKDVAFATYLSEKYLTEYSQGGQFSNLDLLDNLGPAMLLSSRLTFLGKYREFHKFYEEGQFREAAALLLSLLSAKLAPKKFWLTLLTDALPLLEMDEVIFTSQQTYELMHCLEELSLAQKFQDTLETGKGAEDTQKSQGLSEMEKEKLDLMKLALARNLARAVVHEGTLQA